MKEYMDIQLEQLNDFNIYCTNNNITYSIRSGTVLGYLTINNYLPWDDDIDISYKNADYNKILNLWNSGVSIDPQWDNNWEFKKLILNTHNYYIARLTGELHYKHFNPFGMFKLIKDNNQNIKNLADLGGLDLFPQTTFLLPRQKAELKFLTKPIKIKFAGVDTMVLYDKQHIDQLISTYGHPTTWATTHFNCLTEYEKKLRETNIKKLLDHFKIC